MGKPVQLGIFDQPSLNIARAIKEALNNDVRDSGLSREQIIDRMNALADNYGVCLTRGNSSRLTLEVFEKWINPSDMSRQMPLKALPVFCAAVRRYSAIDVIVQPIGLMAITDKEQKLLAWAEAQLTVKEQRRKIRKLEAEL